MHTRSRTQLVSHWGHIILDTEAYYIPAALTQVRDHSRSSRRDLLSESSLDWKSMGEWVKPRNVTQVIHSTSMKPKNLLEHKSGDCNAGDTLQPLLQSKSRPTIVQSSKDDAGGQHESIDRFFDRRQSRYLERSYQDIARDRVATDSQSLSDNATSTDLLLPNRHEGLLKQFSTARQHGGLHNSTNSTVASRIPPIWSPLKHGSFVPCSETDTSYFLVRSYRVSTTERPAPLSLRPRLQRTSSSGTTIFTPSLIVTASPNSEKSGAAQSSSSDSSGWSKDYMSFL